MKSFKNAPPVPRSFGPGRTLAEHLCKMNNPSTQTSQSSEMMTFIYTLSCPKTGAVMYVGKANNPKTRLRLHINQPCSQGLKRWIESLPLGESPIIQTVEKCSLSVWEKREIFWIAHFRALGSLLNISSGGNGVTSIKSDIRKKMSESHLGRKRSPQTVEKVANYHRGRKRSEETCRKIAIAARGRVISPETRAKISQRFRGRKLSLEHRQKIGARTKGRIVSAETRAKMSAAWVGRVVTQKTRAKMAAASRGRKHSAESVERMAAAHRGKKLTEEHLAKMRRRKLSEETKAKLSLAAKGRILSAETRSKMSIARRAFMLRTSREENPAVYEHPNI